MSLPVKEHVSPCLMALASMIACLVMAPGHDAGCPFSARVLLDGARYAGTWSHDEKGGHLFGAIERDGAEAK
jgi:hypothetical protein